MSLFALPGMLLAIYVVHAAITGEVIATDRWTARRWTRAEDPLRFWLVLAIYAGLSLLLMLWF